MSPIDPVSILSLLKDNKKAPQMNLAGLFLQERSIT